MKKKTKKTILRYPGSKTKLAQWIISHFPKYHDTFIDAMGGSGVIILNKEPSGIEVYNDLNFELVNAFRTLRDHGEELVSQLELTLWSSAELELATQPTDEQIERARRFFVRLWMSIYPFDDRPSFRRQKIYTRRANGSASMRVAAKEWTNVDHILAAADRFRGVIIEHMDAMKLIELYDNDRALFYLDPPYLPETRVRKKHYDYEMTERNHIQLADIATAVSGMVVLSGYRSDLYKKLYEDQGWQRVEKEARVDGKKGTRVECLFLNPAVQEHLKRERAQLSLFDFMGDLNE